MRHLNSTAVTILVSALSLALTAACGASRASAPATATPAVAANPAATARAGLQIKLATVYVDDQDKALRFYTDVLGFATKDDETNGPYRWLTVTAPGDEHGTALQLAPAADPAAKAYQKARFEQGQPATMFFTSDVQADYERIKAGGATFTMAPTDIGFATIAMLDDTCGNLIQITQLAD